MKLNKFLFLAVFLLVLAGLSNAQHPPIDRMNLTTYGKTVFMYQEPVFAQSELFAADTVAKLSATPPDEPSPFGLLWGVISRYIDASIILIVVLVFGSMTVIKEVFGSYTKYVSHPDINIHTNLCVRYYYLKEWHIKLILPVVVITITILIRIVFMKPVWSAVSIFEMLIAFICAVLGYFMFAKKFIDWLYKKAKTSRDWITIEEFVALGGKKDE